MVVQKSLVSRSIFCLSCLPLIQSSNFLSMVKPFWIWFWVSCPRGIFLALQPICIICFFIMFRSKISCTNLFTGSSNLLSENILLQSFWAQEEGLSSSLLPFFLSSTQKFSSTYLQLPLLPFSWYLLWYSLMALGMVMGPRQPTWPLAPTLPHRVKKQQWLGLLSAWMIWRMQNLLLLLATEVWLSVALQTLPSCSKMWWLAGLRWQCSSMGAFPLYWIVFITSFSYSLSVFKSSLAGILDWDYSVALADYLAGQLGFFRLRLASSVFFYTLAYFFYSSFFSTVFDFPLPFAFFGLYFLSSTRTASSLDRLVFSEGAGSSLTFFLPSAFPAAALACCSFLLQSSCFLVFLGWAVAGLYSTVCSSIFRCARVLICWCMIGNYIQILLYLEGIKQIKGTHTELTISQKINNQINLSLFLKNN